jgi:dipeptidyl-peptidase-3
MMDPKMVEIGLVPSDEPAKAMYDNYIRNGLITQIVRIKPGKDIEQAHMRNRAAIAHWVYEKGRDGNVIEMVLRDNKTFVEINDYGQLRLLFGELLKEIQRIKSEGDFVALKIMV